ncbi:MULTISPECIES: N-acetylmuramoyl-L-alanine amidase [Anaerostipes]|uniref:N-acetylmuramoyl-L-alanine amidase n=1 Tax=Anaerostipes TaxID=207244 RepID=UPI001FABE307|nr:MULTISPECIES: N-acetylmuramoyl-L-alanine amidase [Anaerostipes]
MAKRVAISVGHSILKNGMCTSAGGYTNEYQYNKKLAPLLKKYLERSGWVADVIRCPEKKFSAASEEKSYKLPLINSKNYDLAVELHLNASNGKGYGAEVYYKTSSGKTYAKRVQKKLATLFRDRGAKKTDSLYFLNGTKPPAILVESFFCDNKNDYKKGKDLEKVARLIAEGIIGGKITDKKAAEKPPYTSIKKSSGKEAIKWLQRKLNQLCEAAKKAPLKIDGLWGPKTLTMLRAYWKQLGWKKGSYAGKKTCTALYKNRKK